MVIFQVIFKNLRMRIYIAKLYFLLCECAAMGWVLRISINVKLEKAIRIIGHLIWEDTDILFENYLLFFAYFAIGVLLDMLFVVPVIWSTIFSVSQTF